MEKKYGRAHIIQIQQQQIAYSNEQYFFDSTSLFSEWTFKKEQIEHPRLQLNYFFFIQISFTFLLNMNYMS